MTDVVIVDCARSAVGKRRGSLATTEAPDLLADVYRGLLDRMPIEPELVDQIIGGNVNQVGQQAGNIARNAWLAAGLPMSVAASTVTTQCGSSQQAFTLGHGMVAGGLADVVIACGVESMSQVPLGSANVPGLGNGRNDRYATHWEITSQFDAADRIATAWGLTRSGLDGYALLSQRRAADALAAQRFSAQIVSVDATVLDDHGEPIGTKPFTQDEGPRPSSAEGLAGLKPNRADAPDALHTAGSTSQIADGAAAALITSAAVAERNGWPARARIVASTLVGSDPVLMLTGPIPATQKVLDHTGLRVDEIDVFEINEAFAAVVLAWQCTTGADPARVNVNGGAIALGHPLGATGLILIAKALAELERISGRYALVAMCCGGGLGTATIIERL